MTQYWVSLSEIIWNIGLVIAGSVGLTEDLWPGKIAPPAVSRHSQARSLAKKGDFALEWPARSSDGGLLDRKIPEALCLAAPDLGFDAAFARREARTGFHPKFRLFRRGRDQA